MNYESVRLFTPHGELSTKSYVYMTTFQDLCEDDVVLVSTSNDSLAIGVIDGHIADTDPDAKKATETIIKFIGDYEELRDTMMNKRVENTKKLILDKLSNYTSAQLKEMLDKMR